MQLLVKFGTVLKGFPVLKDILGRIIPLTAFLIKSI